MKRYLGATALAALLVANFLAYVPPLLARRVPGPFEQIDLLVDIRHDLVSQYVEEPDQTKMSQAAVRGMIDSLNDPYTVYLAPEDLGAFDKQVRGTFSGIGAEVDIHQDRLRIVTPLEESPAWKAGILAGDIVLEINGESTLGLKINDAVEKLMGKEGSQVKVKVRHEAGGEAEYAITRAKINVQTVKGARRGGDGHWDYMLDTADKVGYVRLSQFTDRTADELRAALDSLVKADAHGLILDMRFNPGGLLESAVKVSDMFLEKDKRIVSVKGRVVPEQVYKATAEDDIPPIPVVVLANEGSASAAEVVTGALSDNGRAQFVGTRTFGKGSVQQVRELENGQGALKITNAYYYLPNGRNIHRREGSNTWGVDPAEGSYVPMTPEEVKKMIEVRREGDVLRHAEAANGGGGTPVVTPASIREGLADPQLAAGLEAVLGKIATGQWPPVGQSGAQRIAMQTRHDNLARQRDLLKESLDKVEKEINHLEKGEPATRPATQAADRPAPVTVPDGSPLPPPEGTSGKEDMKEKMPAELPPKPAGAR